MPSQASPFYQGRDWVSSRWTIAETFDTLERVHDLCLYRDTDEQPDSGEETFAILQAVHGLIESLSGQCAIAMADVIPTSSHTGNFESLWLCFEIEKTLDEIKKKILEISVDDTGSTFGSLAMMTQSIKTAFKKLDQ